MVDIMVDLETWGTTPGSDLRSIGAVVFNPEAGTLGAEFYINVTGGDGFGLTRDPSTVEWWSQQSDEAQSVLEQDVYHIKAALARLADWWDAQKGVRFWANGSHFDFVLLEAAFRAIGINPPWTYRAPRDCKTIWDAAGGIDLPFEGTPHNALDDAKHQARCVIEAYRRIRS